MAYMRGYAYLWRDEDRLHIWVADGNDGWQESGWHLLDDGADYPIDPDHIDHGQNVASGVSIPQEIADEYVIMRFAELLEDDRLEETLERTLTKWSRAVLQKNANRLRAMFR